MVSDQKINDQEDASKCDEYLAGWKRAQADYANLKRETEKEKQEFYKFANSELLQKFLPVVDGLDAAMASVPKTTDSDWLRGLKAVYSQIYTFLNEAGLEKIECLGELNPEIHEALNQEESEKKDGEIINVVQSGWKLNGKLIRPAKVTIAKSINHN